MGGASDAARLSVTVITDNESRWCAGPDGVGALQFLGDPIIRIVVARSLSYTRSRRHQGLTCEEDAIFCRREDMVPVMARWQVISEGGGLARAGVRPGVEKEAQSLLAGKYW